MSFLAPTRRSLLALATAAAASLPLSLPVAAQEARITFLHLNDVYEISPEKGIGGLAELMTLLAEERARNPHTITTFGGDLLSPSVLSGLTEGEQMIEIFNALGFSLAVPGNHEFDFGPEIAGARFAASNFTWLGSNMLGADGAPALGTRATAMIEVEGFRIGFFGLIIPETSFLSSPGPNIRFAPVLETARAMTEKLRGEGADLVVALTHLEVETDRALLREVRGLDIILGGHEHDPITFYEGGKLLIKAGYDARYLPVVDVTLRRAEKRGEPIVLWRAEWRYRDNSGIAPDPEVAAIVARWNEKLDAELGVAIGTAAVELDTRRETVRTRESNFGNLVADAMRLSTGAEVALTNGGGIRGDRTYAPGTVITRKDVLAELPFGNVTVLVALSGADLLAALENGVGQVEKKAGRFPQVSGMRFVFDPDRPAGERIVEVEVGGEPLDPARVYQLATNDYLLGGGNGYAMLAKGEVRIDASAATLMATTVMEHVARLGGRIAPEVEGRIRRLD